MKIKDIAISLSKNKIIKYLMGILGLVSVDVITRNKNNLYIFSYAGVGDTIAIASLSNYAKKIYKPQKMVLVCKNNHKSIADLYPSFDDTVVINRTIMYFIRVCNQLNLRNYGQNYIIGNCNLLFKTWHKYSDRLDAIRSCILQAPKSWNPEPIKMPENYHDLGFDKKDIIIAPYANTFKGLEEETCKDLVSVLSRKGFRIYTNINGSEKPIQGTIALNENLEDIISSAEKCAAVISYRSGFSDFMSLNHNINNIVIYPDEYTSVFEDVGIYGSPNISTIIEQEDNKKTVEDIVKAIESI